MDFSNTLDDYVPPGSYELFKVFTVPDADGGTKAIAFPSRIGAYIVALYGIIVVFIFTSLWALLVTIAVMIPFPSHENDAIKEARRRHRHVANVIAWNAVSTWRATYLMACFAFTRVSGSNRDYATIFYGITFLILALGVSVGGVVGGTLYSAKLRLGPFAPVVEREDVQLLLDDHYVTDVDLLTSGTVYRPAMLRSFGIVELAKVVWENNVSISDCAPTNSSDDSEANVKFTYTYSIDGVEFGLQHGSFLQSNITGACETRYDWILPRTNESDQFDRYRIWPSETSEQFVNISKPLSEMLPVPTAEFLIHNDSFWNISYGRYAIVFNSVYRPSSTPGNDPWYLTELDPAVDYTYRIRDRRPPLDCRETIRWSYGNTREPIANITSISTSIVPRVLADVLNMWFEFPGVYRVGKNLRSLPFTPENAQIDAETASLCADMERLIWTAYITSRNVLQNARRPPNVQPERYQEDNIFTYANGTLREGSGDFVLVSREVTALSFNVLVALPSFLVGLWIIQVIVAVLEMTIRDDGTQAATRWKKYLGRVRALNDTQLFQYVYKSSDNGWARRLFDKLKRGDAKHEFDTYNNYPFCLPESDGVKPQKTEQ